MKALLLFCGLLISLNVNAPTLSWMTAFDIKYRQLEMFEEMKHQKELDRYAQHLGWKESRMNWKAVNKEGYMGTWQHGTRLLKEFGLDIRPEEFKADSSIFPPELQYKILMVQIKAQLIQLRKFCAYEGHVIGNVKITKSGMLAATHLGGIGGVKQFLYSNGVIDRADSNGTKISDYMKEFSIYNL